MFLPRHSIPAEATRRKAESVLPFGETYASHRWQQPALDGVDSIAIGLLLAAVAVLLIREARRLLIGEGIRASTARKIRLISIEPRRLEPERRS